MSGTADLRRICVVTGSRAEYGLLRWLMTEIADDPELQLQVVATGMHLAPEFGLTVRQIRQDGFGIDAEVEMLLSSDTGVGVVKSMGVGLIGFADAFQRLAPDIVVVLGDRFEILAAAQAAMILRRPVAHLHGGERTEGAFDEGIRHAITKMAHWHFVAAPEYRSRVVQLGEPPHRVFDFGAPGLDALERLDWLDRPALEADLGMSLDGPLALVTYHPATLGDADPVMALAELLAALDADASLRVVFTYPNADTDGRRLIAEIDAWVAARPGRAKAFASLGQQRYMSLLRLCDVVVGNSSSALIEAPALRRPTVNIGDRQQGRLRAASVIDTPERREAILEALQKARSAAFAAVLRDMTPVYGQGGSSRRIKDELKRVDLSERKHFFDIAHDR